MNERKTMPQAVRAAVTVLNLALIAVGLVAMLVLALGTAGARNEGTFGLFGRSYHLNQSEQMSPFIEKNDLIAVRKTAPTSFQMGDLIAYYQTDGGRDYLIIRKLVGMVGSEYYLEDGKGEETVLDAGKARFLGVVESRSPKLGNAVQFLQSKEGKKIYLWWTGSLLFLLIGVIVLLHVILKNAGRRDEEDDEEDYGVEYMEVQQTFVQKPQPVQEESEEEADFFVDISAFAGDGNEAESVSEPEPAKADESAAAEPAEDHTRVIAVPDPVPEADPAAAETAAEDDFDLDKIISDIQAKLDSEEKK